MFVKVKDKSDFIDLINNTDREIKLIDDDIRRGGKIPDWYDLMMTIRVAVSQAKRNIK